MIGLALVGCEDRLIGDYLPDYDYEPPVVDEVEYNLYIIGEAETLANENARITVQRAINQYIGDKYDAKLNIFYCDASTYAETVAAASADNATNKADIILINSAELMETLLNGNKLVDLLPFLTDTAYKSYGFGTLNVSINDDLLDAAKVNVSGTTKLFCIPNNHVVGEYEYIAINKAIARFYNISDARLASVTTQAAADALWAEIEPNKGLYTAAALTKEMFVETVTGNYALKKTLESEGSFVNVAVYPTVDADEVFSSAFALIADVDIAAIDARLDELEAKKDKTEQDKEEIKQLNKKIEHCARAMEIIYAINTDVKLRNLLQYGEENKNYQIHDGVVVPVSDGNNVYRMNILYTGDVFKAYYCELYGWNAKEMADGILQNEDSVLR